MNFFMIIASVCGIYSRVSSPIIIYYYKRMLGTYVFSLTFQHLFGLVSISVQKVCVYVLLIQYLMVRDGFRWCFHNRKIEEIRICILFRFIVTGLLPGLPNLSDVVLLASAFTSLSYLWSRVTSLFHDR